MERIIPKNSKVKAVLFKRLSMLDLLILSCMLLIAILIFSSNFPNRFVWLGAYLVVCVVMFIGDDEDKTYLELAGLPTS